MKKLNGEYVYGAVPYGYRKGEKKNTIEVDPEAAEVVQKIFQWASDGITVTQIARRLNTDGIQTPSMYLKNVRGNYRVSLYWSFDSVKNILISKCLIAPASFVQLISTAATFQIRRKQAGGTL